MRRSALLLLTLGAAAAIDESAWQFRRVLQGAPGAISSFSLDRDALSGARADLADLRVLLGGRELPYVVQVRQAPASERPRPALFLDRGVAARGLEATLDVGEHTRHNRVTLETAQHNFRAAVRLEASDDRRSWSLVRADAAIFDFTQDGRAVRALEIAYPDSTRRYLRVTVPGWKDPLALSGAAVTFYEPATAVRVLLAEAEAEVTAGTRRTIFTFDLGLAGLPVDRIDVRIEGAAFHRSVDVESSDDRKSWSFESRSMLARFRGGDSLALHSREIRRRHVRLIVHDGDDAPLKLTSARFYGLERIVKVEGAGAGALLYYGNPRASAPEYDLARRMPAGESAPLTLGPVERNPAFRPPAPPLKPWTDRHPALLWTILLAAIMGIGAAVWRLMRGLPPPAAG